MGSATKKPSGAGGTRSLTSDEAKAAAAKSGGRDAKQVAIVIPPPNWKTVAFDIEGISPYVPHRFSEKAKKQIRDKQAQAAKEPKGKRDPESEYKNSIYVLDDGKSPGLPANCIKCSMVRACSLVGGVTMTMARLAFFVKGTYSTRDGRELIPLKKYATPKMREDVVRLAGPGANADLRYRGEFTTWSARIVIDYNADVISPDHLANLLQHAGLSVGVGEMRPEQNGDTFGRFRLVQAA